MCLKSCVRESSRALDHRPSTLALWNNLIVNSVIAVSLARLEMSKRLGIFLVVALAISESLGQMILLPVWDGETILRSSSGRAVRLPHNGSDKVAQEVQEPEVRKLLLQKAGLPEDTALRYMVDRQYWVKVSTFGLGQERAESFAAALREYVQSRTAGHTATYSLDSLKQRLIETKPETNEFRAKLLESFPSLPRNWVKDDPFEPGILTANNGTVSRRFLVIDGEIAWIYSVPLGSGRAGESKVDAQDMDPKIRPKIEAARQEAEQNLEQRGGKKGLGYIHHFGCEVDSILWQKYQIKRRSFRELHPGIIAID
jgi:hypothetical protein